MGIVGEALPPQGLQEEARGPRGEREAGTLCPALRGPRATATLSLWAAHSGSGSSLPALPPGPARPSAP